MITGKNMTEQERQELLAEFRAQATQQAAQNALMPDNDAFFGTITARVTANVAKRVQDCRDAGNPGYVGPDEQDIAKWVAHLRADYDAGEATRESVLFHVDEYLPCSAADIAEMEAELDRMLLSGAERDRLAAEAGAVNGDTADKD